MNRDRFLRLEGQRPDRPDDEVGDDARAGHHLSDRFAAVGGAPSMVPGGPAPPRDPFAPPPDGGPLAIDPQDDGPQRASRRCLACAHENGLGARACARCRAPLDTRAVHNLNLRLHQDEQAEARAARREAEQRLADEQAQRLAEEAARQGPQHLDRLLAHVPLGPVRLLPPRGQRLVFVAVVVAVFGFAYADTGWAPLLLAATALGSVGLLLVVV